MTKDIHNDRLQPMTAQDTQHVYDVQRCFLEVCDLWLRAKGVELIPPVELQSAVTRWREMIVRMQRKGDYRVKPSEVQAVDDVMRWCYERKCELTGNAPELPV